MRRKILALLLAAAMALSLLAGCGGGKALSQVIVDLLDGLYSNVSVEADSDLTAALKQAAAEGGTEEEILSRMIEILNHNGGSITFTRLGSGQQGDHAVTLYFQTGTDPDAAARNALAQWAGTLGTLPDDGSYQADVAMIESENGYYIALDVEVLKAGKPDKPDKDDSGPEPVTLASIAVAHGPDTTNYTVGQKFDPTGLVITATYSNGDIKTIEDITSENSQGVTWTPDGALIEGTYDITISYDGQTTTVSVTVEEEKIEIGDLYVSDPDILNLTNEDVQAFYNFIEGEVAKYPSIQMGTDLDIQKALQSIAQNDKTFTAFNNNWSTRESTYKQAFDISEDNACLLLLNQQTGKSDFMSTDKKYTSYYGFYGLQVFKNASSEELFNILSPNIEKTFANTFSTLTLSTDADSGYTNTYELYILLNDCYLFSSTGLSANFLLLRTRTPAT